jgi:hypothetical protein
MFILYFLLAIYLLLVVFSVAAATPHIGFWHSLPGSFLWPVGIVRYWLHSRKA